MYKNPLIDIYLMSQQENVMILTTINFLIIVTKKSLTLRKINTY